MTEKQINSPDKKDKEFSRSAKIAAGLVGAGLLAGGITDQVNRHNMENEMRDSIAQEADHKQAVLDEIAEKSNEPFVITDETEQDLVALLPPIDDRTLYGLAVEATPEDSNGTYSVNYVLESTQAIGIYQPGEEFALVVDDIDGKESLIVKRVEPLEVQVGTVAL